MICPCCGQRVDHEDPDRIAFVAGLSVQEAQILRFVFDSAPDPALNEKLTWHLWGDDIDGGPDDPHGLIGVKLVHINRKLAPQRLRLTRRANGSDLGGVVAVPLEPATHVKHSANVGAGDG